jgi:hypothetical protein
MSKIFLKVGSFVTYCTISYHKAAQIALYLGLRQKEWLFLSCHNSWIVFRLVNIDGNRVLAYSPVLEMANSSIPFCAYFGVLLSIVENVPVQQTSFPADPILDMLDEDPDEDGGSISKSDSENPSDEYTPPGGGSAGGDSATAPPMTRLRSKAMEGNVDAEFMVCFPRISYDKLINWIGIHTAHVIFC